MVSLLCDGKSGSCMFCVGLCGYCFMDFYYLQERGGGTWQPCISACGKSFGGHFGQPMPITTHWLIGQVVPYQLMYGNWHGLVEMAAKIGLSWQVSCAIVRAAAACFVVVLCGYRTIHKM